MPWGCPSPRRQQSGAQLFGQIPTALGERAGVIDELLARYPLPATHRRRGNQQNLIPWQGQAGEKALQLPGNLLRAMTLKQIIAAQHNDQQIRVGWNIGCRSGYLTAIDPHVADRPAGFRS